MDATIAELANCPFSYVCKLSEGRRPKKSWHAYQPMTAGEFLVARFYREAIFFGDLSMVAQLVERLDGCVKAEGEDRSATAFADELNRLLALDISDPELSTAYPEESTLTLLAKRLIDIAKTDIYLDKNGNQRQPRPDERRDRERAAKMVLERSGGRRGDNPLPLSEDEISVKSWITGALPESNEV